MTRVSALSMSTLLWAGICLGEPAWETVVTGPVTVKNRALPGSPIKKI